MDPSVRVTYNAPSKKINAPTGSIITKSTVTTSHSQRITIKNTRVFPIDKLIVKDQVPISSDARITVAVTQPALPDRANTTDKITPPKEIVIRNVKGGTINARWAPLNDENEVGEANSDGFVEWICRMESSSSTDLNLSWDVTAPKGLKWSKA